MKTCGKHKVKVRKTQSENLRKPNAKSQGSTKKELRTRQHKEQVKGIQSKKQGYKKEKLRVQK